MVFPSSAAEDWLKPSAVLEAFEARSARMSVACAKNLSKFENQEEGTHFVFAAFLFHFCIFF